MLFRSAPGTYPLSCSATDACQRTVYGNWELNVVSNDVVETNSSYLIRNLSDEFVVEFNSPTTNIRVYDLYGRILNYSTEVVSNFTIEKVSDFRIIQFEMNGLKKQILLGVK